MPEATASETTAPETLEAVHVDSSAVEVRDSIGNGVFATRKIRRGEVLAEISGRVLTDPDHSSDYCMDLGGDYSLEPDPPFRFLNHSCNPNAELFQYTEDEDDVVLRMWIHAIRKIRKGDEITIDYSWPAHAAIACLCGSSKCRGWIVDPTELKQLKKQLKKERKNQKKK